jgi:hypothetical protein
LVDTVVWVLTTETCGGSIIQGLESAIGTDVDLDIYEGAVVLAPLEGVTGISMLLEVTIRSSTIREKNHHLVDGLGVLRQVIPEHIRILQMGLGIPLLGMDEVRELGRVTDEEDGSVVEDPIPVTFLGPQFEREPARVAGGVS